MGNQKIVMYSRGCVRIIKQVSYPHADVFSNMYSVWLPISGPVEDKPITVWDGSTCKREELVTNDVIRSAGHGVREAWVLLHDEQQNFYYLSQQTREPD